MSLLFSLLLLFATPDGMAPSPAQYLHGKTFQSPDGWFSIETPAEGWEWFEMAPGARQPDGQRKSVSWYVRSPDPKGISFAVMETYNVNAPPIDDEYLETMEAETRKALAPDDQVSDFSAALLNVPTVNTVRYQYKVTKKSGKVGYRFAYATGWKHKVFVIGFASEPQEPRELKRVLVSLRWKKKP
ncbi:MAG: hypothetical protein JOZ54_05320 [Acidobacteria bacterium]|nr:hypothetical protein [Acidobacteriota bacterium]